MSTADVIESHLNACAKELVPPHEKPSAFHAGMLRAALDEIRQLQAVKDAVLNLLDDWDNDRTDVGSIAVLEKELGIVCEIKCGNCGAPVPYADAVCSLCGHGELGVSEN